MISANAKRFEKIVRRLERAMPEARIALRYEDELQLLVSVILSAQSTDAMVNKITPELFARFPTAAHYARRAHQLLIWHGRRTCESRRPHCSRCAVLDLCPRKGVRESD